MRCLLCLGGSFIKNEIYLNFNPGYVQVFSNSK